MAQRYQIIDEPQPGGLSSIVVQPFWPLLGIMFVGPGFSWSWFVLNGFAMGSPTRKRELSVALAGVAGSAVLVAVLGSLFLGEIVPDPAKPYLILVHVVFRLAVSYALYSMQSRTFGIYEYYGGQARNGLPVVVLGYFVGRALVPRLFEISPFWALVLA